SRAEVPGSDDLIGRPVAISTSVKVNCEGKESIGSCKELLPLLSKMAEEPRDLIWAPAIEARLRDLVTADPGEFTIRTIECRQSLCAAEVVSIHGQFHFIMGVAHDPSLNKNVLPQTSLLGYEDGPTGAQLKNTVTFSMFKRR
ncbi:MAG TPA: hypothetical protein VLC91_03270, partial [Spongiibacteraceae bacterium]|nr:hypothetical protein [Spongiibacteraceae bacterium]